MLIPCFEEFVLAQFEWHFDVYEYDIDKTDESINGNITNMTINNNFFFYLFVNLNTFKILLIWCYEIYKRAKAKSQGI